MTERSATEAAEVQAAKRDREAFAPLYERYVDAVYGYCLRRLDSADAAADATSDVFVRAMRNLGGFRGDSFRSWLFAIARNVVIDRYRTRKPTESLPDAMPSAHSGPEHLALQREMQRELRAALGELTEQQQDVVNMRLAGLTGKEIAAAMGISIGAVKATQVRAFTRLRELMSAHAHEVQHD